MPNGDEPRVSLLEAPHPHTKATRPVRRWIIPIVVLGFVFAARATIEFAARSRALEIQAIQKDTSALRESLTALDGQSKNAMVLRDRIVSLGKLDRPEARFSTYLDRVEAITLPNIAFTEMDADIPNTLKLQVLAPTYRDAAQQLRAMEQSGFFKDVEAQAMTSLFDERGNLRAVKFSITLKTAP